MRIRTMPDARREFVRHFSPRLLLAFVGVSLVVRLIVSEWRWSDLLVVGAVLALQPFLEWVLHVTLLHDRPHEIAGRTFDTVAAQDHRKHHADPRDIPLTFIARRWVIYLVLSVVVVAAALWWLIGSGTAATFLLVASCVALAYEWTHYLIHTDVPPKSWYYRKIHAAHRLHHYRNEQYWFGVTSNVGDMALGTYPDKDAVPVSPTAKALLQADRRVGPRHRV